ncbi:MAG: FecCD family ABC transporter permease [Actinomycetota bacterium]
MGKAIKYSIVLIVILAALAIVAASIGSASISLGDTARIIASYIPGLSNLVDTGHISPNEFAIIGQIRLPRIFTSILVGIALASSGVIFQGIFRNPMADPYIIGVSAGAAFGATIGLLFATGIRFLNISAVSVFAFGGAVAVTLLVYNISRVRNRVSVLTLLLAGVALSALLSSINSFILMFQAHDMAKVIFWLMGGLTASTWHQLAVIAPAILILLGLAVFFMNELNIISLGDERATQLGVNTEHIKKFLLVLASLIAAAAVSVSGLIGFVGLITPHIMRLIVGPDHKVLYPTSAIAGGIVLLTSDTIARMVLMPREIPVGIVTSIIGVPFFLYLLIRSKRQVF